MWYGFRATDFIDILIVAILINRALVFLVGTRAVQLFKGFLFLSFLALVSSALDFKLLSWVFGSVLTGLFIALPIVFQPELRNILEEIGRGSLWKRRVKQENIKSIVDRIIGTLDYFRTNKVGALLVFQGETGLKEYWRSSVKLNAEITEELLISMFWKNNPLHDGAAILDRERIIAGACYLPLTDNAELSRWLGTRHRAGLGITEVSDALVLIASEERGEVSMAYKGHLSRNMKDAQLQKLLTYYFMGSRESTPNGVLRYIKALFKKAVRDKNVAKKD